MFLHCSEGLIKDGEKKPIGQEMEGESWKRKWNRREGNCWCSEIK